MADIVLRSYGLISVVSSFSFYRLLGKYQQKQKLLAYSFSIFLGLFWPIFIPVVIVDIINKNN